MGSGSSSTNKRTFKQTAGMVMKVSAAQKAAQELGGAAKHDSYPSASQRNDSLIISDTSGAWAALAAGNADYKPQRRTLGSIPRRRSTNHAIGSLSAVPSYHSEFAVKDETSCFTCGKNPGMLLHSCRVCSHVYHEACLAGRVIGDHELQLLKNSDAFPGWSCPECGDLVLLITDDEMQEVTELFDKYDTNRDSHISLDEFLHYRRKRFVMLFDREMLHDEVEEEQMQFNLIDQDNNGSISWHEFMNYESAKILARKPEVQVAEMLTEKELGTMQRHFRSFDEDENGFITEIELMKAFTVWYSYFEEKDQSSDYLRKQLVELRTKQLMKADSDGDRCVSWEEFVSGLALCFLTSRPNDTRLHLEARRRYIKFRSVMYRKFS